MEQKGRCIICHTDNSELSDEHVFPDAIGGGYHIYTVCKKCNSFLGEAVDNPLTDHIIIKLFREDYKLAGKTGKIPSFLLDSEIQNKDNPEEKMKFYIDENNELKLKYLPNTKEVIDENGNTKFEVKVDYSDKDKLAKIQEKKIERYQKKGFSANLSKPEIVSQKGMTIQSELKFDLLKYRIGLLKIAYESMCDFFPEYENDIYGLQISDILRKARYIELLKKIWENRDIINKSLKAVNGETLDGKEYWSYSETEDKSAAKYMTFDDRGHQDHTTKDHEYTICVIRDWRNF